MTLHVNEVEALWVLVTGVGVLLSLVALFDALRGLRAAGTDTGPSHEVRNLTARGNVRREFLRFIIMSLLLSIAAPALVSDRPVTLSPTLIALMLVPVVLLVNVVFDARDRGRLAGMLTDLVRGERDALALESSVQEGNALTREGIKHAEAAYHEANTINQKIADLTELVGGKEDKP